MQRPLQRLVRTISHLNIEKQSVAYMSTTEEVRSALRAKSVEKDTFDTNPVKQFVSWFRDACSARATMPDAMTLSTVAYCPKTKLMKPSSRAVLVKDIVLDNKLIPAYMYLRPEAKVDMMDATTYLAQQQGSGAQVEDGFIFCTNYNSRKGVEIEENPWVSLYFLWHELERAVRIEGTHSRRLRRLMLPFQP